MQYQATRNDNTEHVRTDQPETSECLAALKMITEENLDTECGEIHYVSENGRVEGLIFEQEERTKRERPRSAKGRRRPSALIIEGSRCNSDSEGSCRTYNVESINERGVTDLFSDILYDPGNDNSSDTENIGDYDEEFKNSQVSENGWTKKSFYSDSTDSSNPQKYGARWVFK